MNPATSTSGVATLDKKNQVRSNVDPTFNSLVGSGRSGGGPPWLLSSRESIHPLSVYGQLSLEHRILHEEHKPDDGTGRPIKIKI
ncbi:hypothetical protein R6Q59_017153 [Mikania micrantha]